MEQGCSEQRLAGGTPVYINEVHRFGTDAMLLSDFCNIHRLWTACDLGSGCGIIPLRWHDMGHRGPCWAIELDEAGTALLRRAAAQAGATQIHPLTADLRRLPDGLPYGRFDLVSCNPPYFTGGKVSKNPARGAARHELHCTVLDVCRTAASLLRDGGRLCLCNQPRRLADCIAGMRESGIEPKRLRFVRQHQDSLPWLFLLDGRRAGRPGLSLLPDLVIEAPGGGFSAELLDIYPRGAPPAADSSSRGDARRGGDRD